MGVERSSPSEDITESLRKMSDQLQTAAAIAHEHELDFLRYLLCMASDEVELLLKDRER